MRTGRPKKPDAKEMKSFRLKPSFIARLKSQAKTEGKSVTAFIESDPRLKA